MGQIAANFPAQGNLALVVEASDQVGTNRAIMQEMVLEDHSVEVVPSTEASKRPSLLPFFRKRKACSCSNITIMRSRVHEERAL